MGRGSAHAVDLGQEGVDDSDGIRRLVAAQRSLARRRKALHLSPLKVSVGVPCRVFRRAVNLVQIVSHLEHISGSNTAVLPASATVVGAHVHDAQGRSAPALERREAQTCAGQHTSSIRTQTKTCRIAKEDHLISNRIGTETTMNTPLYSREEKVRRGCWGQSDARAS